MKAQTVIVTSLVLLLVLVISVRPIEAQGSCTDPYEPNNDASSARALQLGSIQATICPTGDLDIYKFTLNAGDGVYLRLTNLPADFDIGLYSSNQDEWVATSENGGTDNEEIRWTARSRDVIYIVVWAYGDNVASRVPYQLTLQHFPNLNLEPGGIAGSSAQIQSQLSDLRPLFTQSDYDALVEALQYATDATQCIIEIKHWRAIGIIVASDPDAINACGMALSKIVEVMSKYINPDVVGGMANCADIYFARTIRGTISDSNPSQDYCFEVGGRQYVSIRMFDVSDTNPTLDPIIKLYDENGRLIASNDDGPGIGYNSFMSVLLPSGGIYRLVATRYSGSGSYWLRIEDGHQAAAGDVNKDCVVNDVDGNLIKSALGKNDTRYDIDLNGIVNTRDWSFYLQAKGTRCGQ
jgi:hypothetical protein